MKLYQVHNRYGQFALQHYFVVVIAGNEKDAERLATDKFKASVPADAEKYSINEDWWLDLEVILLADAVDGEYVSEVL